jgi:hypothetical protein
MKRQSAMACSLAVSSVAIAAMFACNSQLPVASLPGAVTVETDGQARRILPDSVSLDISEVGTESQNAARVHGPDRCVGIPVLDRTLRAGAHVIHSFHRLADRGLRLAARVNMDLGDSGLTQIEGTLLVHGQPVPYKADFAPFDVDGDGNPDGSGLPDVEPVALRMWVASGEGFERFFAAMVAVRPSSENLGAGEFFVRPGAPRPNIDDAPLHDGATDGFLPPADLQIYVKYDRTGDAHKWNEAFVTGRLSDGVYLLDGHQRIDVRLAETDPVEKTIRSTSNFAENPHGFENYAFAAHFLRGESFVLLSGLSTGGTMQVDFSGVCVNLAECVIDVSGGCADFDTQDMAFLDAPVGGETDFPADFPEAPTF